MSKGLIKNRKFKIFQYSDCHCAVYDVLQSCQRWQVVEIVSSGHQSLLLTKFSVLEQVSSSLQQRHGNTCEKRAELII